MTRLMTWWAFRYSFPSVGYGDGRAISVGEVVVGGDRWEMQLKGAGSGLPVPVLLAMSRDAVSYETRVQDTLDDMTRNTWQAL